MATEDKKVENESSVEDSPVSEKSEPTTPFYWSIKKSGVRVGINVTKQAPFGFGPDGKLLAPFGYTLSGRPRLRKAPSAKSTNTAKKRYMEKKKDQAKTLLENIIGEKVLNNISLQKNKDDNIETVSKLDTIEEEDENEEMPRHKKAESTSGYGNPGMNTSYMVGIAVIAAGAFYLYRNPNMLTKSKVGNPVYGNNNLNVEKKSTNNISSRKDNIVDKSDFSYDY
jgi:hypothetical protein